MTTEEWDEIFPENNKVMNNIQEELKTKCYCGHTTYCDCSPLELHKEEPNQELNCFDCNKSLEDCTCIEDTIDMKQETLEEAAEKFRSKNPGTMHGGNNTKILNAFKEGAKWQQERMYSEEDMISFAYFYFQEEFNSTMQTSKSTDKIFKEWFEQFKNRL